MRYNARLRLSLSLSAILLTTAAWAQVAIEGELLYTMAGPPIHNGDGCSSIQRTFDISPRWSPPTRMPASCGRIAILPRFSLPSAA